jgi:hypothetical protein
MKRFLLAIVLIFAVFGFFMSDPVNRLMVFSLEGEASSGSILGVGVGEDAEAMKERLLSAGFRETSPLQDRSCLELRAMGDQGLIRFVTDDWRNGVVCVLTENGDVRSVAWGFSPISL